MNFGETTNLYQDRVYDTSIKIHNFIFYNRLKTSVFNNNLKTPSGIGIRATLNKQF